LFLRRSSVAQAEEKIAAVVVTYNRKDLLGQCLDSLLRQSRPLDALYLIDNHSTDGTYEYLLGRNLIAPADRRATGPVETARPAATSGTVHYIRMPENTGGAGGFHEGMKRATAAGFDWLWLMDDDLLTAPDALEILLQKRTTLRRRGKESFLLNSLVVARDGPDSDVLAFPLQELTARGYPKRVYHWRLSEVRDQVQDGLYRWACPFNGTLVPARAVAEVGLPNKDFFLWGDERDFLWRAAQRFELYTAVDSKVFHPLCRVAGFDWRQYYGIRNALLINRHFRWPALRNAKLILASLIKGARHGRSGLLLVLRAIRDGLTGRLGRREEYHP
jgi:rhamnopyranosyl-N-acetylglucosaminyl-diphospho-decaprenol beta-1,3/1,4-galactofuranosyltransferase